MSKLLCDNDTMIDDLRTDMYAKLLAIHKSAYMVVLIHPDFMEAKLNISQFLNINCYLQLINEHNSFYSTINDTVALLLVAGTSKI